MTRRPAVLHPARFTPSVLRTMALCLGSVRPVLDPFAGTGLIHELPGVTVGVELEPEWAAMSAGTVNANALALPFPDGAFPAAATSPCYGNRFADHHRARDGSVRRSYTHDLRRLTGDDDRNLHPDNAGALHWGDAYRAFHSRAWAELRRVLAPGAVFVLNVADHYRRRELQRVCDWHATELREVLGFTLTASHFVPTAGLRHGANRERAGGELVMRFTAPE